MNITVDALRGLSGNHGIVYNAETQTLAKSSVGHFIAGLFGIKSAQAVNRQTLEEIKKAVLFDDRYFAANTGVCNFIIIEIDRYTCGKCFRSSINVYTHQYKHNKTNYFCSL